MINKALMSVTVACLFVSFTSACGLDESDLSDKITVEVSNVSGDSLAKIIRITSKDNDIQIKSIVVNRGNCKSTDELSAIPKSQYPIRLKFGDSAIDVFLCHQVLEVHLDTSSGTGDFNFSGSN